jgi:hypothetical protein
MAGLMSREGRASGKSDLLIQPYVLDQVERRARIGRVVSQDLTDLGRVLEQQPGQPRRLNGHVDGIVVTCRNKVRQIADMVEVGMGDEHGVQLSRELIERKRMLLTFWNELEPTVEEQTRTGDTDADGAATHLETGAMEPNRHAIIRHDGALLTVFL